MPTSIPNPFLYELSSGIGTDSEAQSLELAQSLASIFPENTTIAIEGEMGAGKTTFLKGMACAWGMTQPVLSPTYNLYFTYSCPTRNLLHLDAYRLQSDTEAESLLIEDFLEPPWCLAIEWPDKVPSLVDSQAWWLTIRCTGEFSRHYQLRLPCKRSGVL